MFGNMLFYPGQYEVDGSDISHKVTNSSIAPFVGKTLLRHIEMLSADALVLSGTSSGVPFVIKWQRAPKQSQ
jgi:hypothetical protein